MLEILAFIFWILLVIATVTSAVALFISIARENNKEKATFKPQPVEKMSYGLSKWELRRTTRQVLKNDKKGAYRFKWN